MEGREGEKGKKEGGKEGGQAGRAQTLPLPAGRRLRFSQPVDFLSRLLQIHLSLGVLLLRRVAVSHRAVQALALRLQVFAQRSALLVG